MKVFEISVRGESYGLIRLQKLDVMQATTVSDAQQRSVIHDQLNTLGRAAITMLPTESSETRETIFS